MIKVEKLSFTYPKSQKRAVDDITFNVASGEVFGFLGPSGAGKSTTQKILISLLRGYDGYIEILGKNLKDWGSDYYERIGVSFELPNHYQKLTARENLDFFRSLYSGNTREPNELLDMVGLLEDADTRVSQFSKGMQMRLNFARSLLNEPELLFLDEPTAGLDPVNARKIRDIVKDLRNSGVTIFLTTHDMNVADELCDRVAFIVDGSIAALDSPRELKLKWGERKVRVEYNNGKTDIFPLDGIGNNLAFLRLIRVAQLETIHTQEATLEDVFVKVTGRSLI